MLMDANDDEDEDVDDRSGLKTMKIEAFASTPGDN